MLEDINIYRVLALALLHFGEDPEYAPIIAAARKELKALRDRSFMYEGLMK